AAKPPVRRLAVSAIWPTLLSPLPRAALPPGWRLFHIRVKDRLPLSVLFLPDRGGVVRPRLIFSVVGAFDRHVVGGDNCVGSISHDFVIADRKRFHVPLLHVRQFLLQVGRAFSVNTH